MAENLKLKILRQLRRTLFGLCVVSVIFLVRNKISHSTGIALRSYSVVMSFLLLMSFLLSLLKTPVIEIFVRRTNREPNECVRRYCRNATVCCMIFLIPHFGFTIVTMFLSFELWFIYNGAVAYFLVGAMFLIEFLVRKKLFLRPEYRKPEGEVGAQGVADPPKMAG